MIERDLYDAFAESLLVKVQDGTATPKELEIVLAFLKYNNIQATKDHPALNGLANAALDLPFDEDNVVPIRGVG